jgi:hypothetical protein
VPRKLAGNRAGGCRRFDGGHVPVEAAQVYSALGETRQAFELLLQVVDNPSEAPLILFIKEDPAFDSLHSDARWNALLAMLNLADEVEPD